MGDRIVAVVQARTGSTRLPGKVLADVGGMPLLQHVLSRAQAALKPDLVVVATTVSPADDVVARFLDARSVAYVRGSEGDVLDRYRTAAAAFDADVIVRLTADCPLLDPTVVDRVIDAFVVGRVDYASNVDPPTYPDGLDVEVFSRDALERTWRDATRPSEREHVTPYIRDHPGSFRCANVSNVEDLSLHRWTVDEPADLTFVRRICEKLGIGTFGMDEVLELLRREPDLVTVNAGIERNAGWKRSQAQEAEQR